MKQPNKRFSNPSAIMALGISLFAGSAQQLAATNDGVTEGDCDKKEHACLDCNDKPTGEMAKSAAECSGSFNLSIGVGQASIQRAGNFLTYSRAGLSEGQAGKGYYRSFDEVRKTILNSGNVASKAPQNLTIVYPRIDSALYSPSIFDYATLNGTDYIEDSNGLKQALTDTAFTDIKMIDGGFVVRVWRRDALASLDKVGNFYIAPDELEVEPLTSTTFLNPDYPQENNRLVVTFKENLSGSSERTITKLYDHQDVDTYIVTTYDGDQASGNPLERQTLAYEVRAPDARPWDYAYTRTLERASVSNGVVSATLKEVLKNKEIYKDISLSVQGGDINGKRIQSKTIAYGDPDAQVTTYEYYEEPNNSNKHGRLKSQQNPDGSWEYWDYTDDGGNTVIETKYSSWKDVSFDNHELGLKQQTTIHTREATRVVSLQNVQISKEKYTTEVEVGTSRLTSVVQRWNGSDWASTTTCFEAPGANTAAKGRPLCTILPDGTAVAYEYTESNNETTVTQKKGAVANDISEGAAPIVNKGVQTVTVYNQAFAKISESVSDIESGLELNSTLATEFDSSGRPTKIVYNNNQNDFIVKQYGCCGLEYSRDRSGASTTYYRDALKRVYRVVTKRSSNGDAITTNTDFNGLTTKVTRSSGAGTLLVSEVTRTLGGLTTTTSSPDADGDGNPEISKRVIVHNAGTGSTTTNTAPDRGENPDGTPLVGAKTITATFLDGKTKSVSGSAVTNSVGGSMTYDYGTHALNGGGVYAQVTQPNGAQSTKSFRDQLGRSFLSENADGTYSSTEYYAQRNEAGELANDGFRGKVRTVKDADENALAVSGSHVTYTYNGEGERVGTTTKLSNGQEMTTLTEHDDVDDADIGVSHRYRTWVNGVFVSANIRSGDGYKSKSITLAKGNIAGVTELADQSLTASTALGISAPSNDVWVSSSTSERTVPVAIAVQDPDTGEETLQVTKNVASYVIQTAANNAFSIQTYKDGLMKQSASYAAGADAITGTPLTLNSVTHDAFGRALTQTDARTGTVTYNGYNENGSVTGMTDAGSRATTYKYDELGRTVSVDAPDTVDKDGNAIANITHTSYNLTGTVAGTWGDQTYARYNVYDDQNRLVVLRTFQNLAHGTEPTLATTGFASTTWNYNPLRGWLDNKRYDDDKGTDYTYTNAGRLMTRTWSRGVVTTYSYDQGQMVSTDYSDATAKVVYAYDNFGRPTLVTQGIGATANQHAYIYDPATLVLDKESISYASGLSRTLDRSQDNLLRPSGFQLMNGTTEEHATSYGYDTAGRLAGVHSGATYPVAPATADFTYGYLSNSGSLLQTVTGPAHTVTNTYETTRNVLDVKSNAATAAISAFDYSVNALGQRDDVSRSGSAFTSANTETWSYNAKGEVVTANSSNNAFDRSYEFDGIGNRKKSADSITLPAVDNYSANTLNQLTTVNGGARIHDADGNLTDNGTHLYEWDAENRLIEIKLKTDNSTVATYAYDFQSRRITKTVGSTVTNFVYNGWNPIAEFSGTTLSKTYTWGMDLSGSMQGAGGVGGLLSVNDGNDTYYPTYDGNGNVSEYVDATGAVVAHYEYDAFGQVVAAGTKKDDFTHQFSTKQLDSESGLHYYGYRFYDSSNGRWLGRDPLWERGGLNLFGFVLNSTVNFIDVLGLDKCAKTIISDHLFGKDGGNWEHFNSEENDGSFCYVGCGMDDLNRRQREKYPENPAGTDPMGDDFFDPIDVSDKYFDDRVPDDYPRDSDVGGLHPNDADEAISTKIIEIIEGLCGGANPCCSVKVTIECPVDSSDHGLCGETIEYPCDEAE